MIKGQCQKIESLSDGSLKLSIYVDRRYFSDCVPLLYQNVTVSLPDEGIIEDTRQEFYRKMIESIESLAKSMKEEIETEQKGDETSEDIPSGLIGINPLGSAIG